MNSWHVSRRGHARDARRRHARGAAAAVPRRSRRHADAERRALPDLRRTRRGGARRRRSARCRRRTKNSPSKLETADRLTRIAVVILIGGTLALFVAVCVLGAVVLSRGAGSVRARGASRSIRRPRTPEPFDTPRRGRMGVVAVVGGAAIAAILIVAAGIALLRAQQGGRRASRGAARELLRLDHLHARPRSEPRRARRRGHELHARRARSASTSARSMRRSTADRASGAPSCSAKRARSTC